MLDNISATKSVCSVKEENSKKEEKNKVRWEDGKKKSKKEKEEWKKKTAQGQGVVCDN